MRRCSHCGSKLKQNTKYCPECGNSIVWKTDNSYSTDSVSSKAYKAIILVLLLIIVVSIAFYTIKETDLPMNIEVSQETEIIETAVPETTVPKLAFADDPAAISSASQSVVKLDCYDKDGQLFATGSGFACFDNNVIVTNYHVIEGGVYSIEVSTEDGQTFDISNVLVTDEDKDIAILTTSRDHNLTLLQPGNSEMLQKGEKVVAIGSPLGLLNSVSTGVFSGYLEDNGINVLQFTASISNGSSGGALFNNDGEVLGITFASIDAGQNLNLAIPIELVEQLYHSKNNPMTLAEFFDTFVPTYDVGYVTQHRTELLFETFYIDCWVSTCEFYPSYVGWLYCVDSPEDIYFSTDDADEFVSHNHDWKRAMNNEILRANYRYEIHGFSPLKPPSVSSGNHVRLLCIGVDEPTISDGKEITPYALIVSTIEVLE